MSGLDRLICDSLKTTLNENLGAKTISKIEKRLAEKYGISLGESIEQFSKIDAVLREFFGAGADGIETKVLEKILDVKSKSTQWFTIKEYSIVKSILESLGDEDKSKIIQSVDEEPKVISDILKDCKIPQTSGYRKINSLIKLGLLSPAGEIEGSDGRKIFKYISIFNNIKINFVKNRTIADVQLTQPNFGNSSILQTILGN